MASWWMVTEMLDDVDLEENSIVSRVMQAVGLFGDILSLEDTMEPILSNDAEHAPTGEHESPREAVEMQQNEKQEEVEQEGNVETEENRGNEWKTMVELENEVHGGCVEERKEQEGQTEMTGKVVEMEVQNEEKEGGKTQRERGIERTKEAKMEDEVGEDEEKEVESKEQQNSVIMTKNEAKEREEVDEEREEQDMECEEDGKMELKPHEGGQMGEMEGKGDEEVLERGRNSDSTEEEKLEKTEIKGNENHPVEKEEKMYNRKDGEMKEELEKIGNMGAEVKEREETVAKEQQKLVSINEEEMEDIYEWEENQWSNQLDPSRKLSPATAEKLRHHTKEAGSEANRGNDEEGWDAAQNHNQDIYCTSRSKDSDAKEASGHTLKNSVNAPRGPTEVQTRRVKKQCEISLTSLPAGGHHCEMEAGDAEYQPVIESEPQTGNHNLDRQRYL